ncbi:class C sortase [Acetatifactor muris]|uniref:Sortase family protein n=1 Tax=Acetatifactor muris TaxID=879566 RepID=A0A2K4ZFM7_9FIRM|nr:class C sortase [Acetatifactor muris]MCI8800748.1 class C sortase [Lachnospiraceae bacterium]MCR2047712.1 class C sortase [Acetatifactor muris]SOY29280.1 Sortase family protein [Acetatifactor muris]
MKKHITTIIVCTMFAAGLSLLLYPFVSNQWNNYRQSKLITTYEEAVTEMEETGRVDYKAEWIKAQNYNNDLIPYILPDSFSTAEVPQEGDAQYLSCLNLTEDGMMGYVQIPDIGVKIPIYHTTNEDVLQKAAGHLPGSSLPVGGEGTHTVISAHRGLPSAALFTDLDKLEEGDHFLLSVLDDTLCYEVDQITVVEPTETQALAAEAGKDLATLLTCTPYGVNSHRLLVRGHRVPYEAIQEETAPMAGFSGLVGPSMHTSYLLWVMIGLTVTGLFILLLYLYDKRLKKKEIGDAT